MLSRDDGRTETAFGNSTDELMEHEKCQPVNALYIESLAGSSALPFVLLAVSFSFFLFLSGLRVH